MIKESFNFVREFPSKYGCFWKEMEIHNFVPFLEFFVQIFQSGPFLQLEVCLHCSYFFESINAIFTK